MPFDDSDLLMISALQHLLFCPRQCALIHIEQAWAENRFTMEGQILHERVHSGNAENRRNVRVEFGMQIHSLELGLTGQCDIVEIEFDNPGRKKIISVLPVEYKRGRPKQNNSDNVQLCAQALCLEEMLGVQVKSGMIYYGKERQRHEVVFSDDLRALVRKTAHELHVLFDSGKTPPPEYTKKCDTCSLLNICLPDKVRKDVRKYMKKQIRIAGDEP
ncbi:MAG: CRISPR-associated protein Cas4 [Spirochaetales bacterium]|nr:CRISPR-associated protein Cas4 [Spirochaetales bacterium]